MNTVVHVVVPLLSTSTKQSLCKFGLSVFYGSDRHLTRNYSRDTQEIFVQLGHFTRTECFHIRWKCSFRLFLSDKWSPYQRNFVKLSVTITKELAPIETLPQIKCLCWKKQHFLQPSFPYSHMLTVKNEEMIDSSFDINVNQIFPKSLCESVFLIVLSWFCRSCCGVSINGKKHWVSPNTFHRYFFCIATVRLLRTITITSDQSLKHFFWYAFPHSERKINLWGLWCTTNKDQKCSIQLKMPTLDTTHC